MNLPHVQSANTILYCRSWHETVRFYRDVLGMTIHHAVDWFVEFQIAPNCFISIADASRATIASAGGSGITLAWRVDNVEKAHRHLSQAGVAVGPLQSKWGARLFYFRDPEGHRVEIWSNLL